MKRKPSPEQILLWSSSSARKHSADIELLRPLAVELAHKAGEAGCTIGDVRLAAVQRGLLSGNEKGRELSYLGAVMRAAGLIGTEEYRRSTIIKSHGNLHRAFVLEAFKRESA